MNAPALAEPSMKGSTMSNRICCVDGCKKMAGGAHKDCPMHHARMARTRSYAVKPRAGLSDWRYVRTTVPESHPLFKRPSKGGGRPVWYHRVVLFDKIGLGPHRCHWCAKPLSWGVDLYVDHVDANKLNNDPSNLVQCCCRCNARRACNLAPIPWVAQ